MKQLRTVFLTPAVVTMLLLFIAPLLIVVVYSVLSRGAYGGVVTPWTLENYVRLVDPLYLRVLVRSVVVAALTTTLCLAAGFPMALFIWQAPKHKTLLLNLVILPFWTSFLIRTYAWMFLLRDTGLVNSTLQALHLIHAPLPLLFNDAAVVLGLFYAYVPFTVLPIYATIERLDRTLLDAAADLGARPWSAIRLVVLPLCKPGLLAGSVLTFIPCLGAYLTPDLLGGGRSVMIGTVIQNQFTNARDWPFGAALSLLMLCIVAGCLMLLSKKQQDTLL